MEEFVVIFQIIQKNIYNDNDCIMITNSIVSIVIEYNYRYFSIKLK